MQCVEFSLNLPYNNCPWDLDTRFTFSRFHHFFSFLYKICRCLPISSATMRRMFGLLASAEAEPKSESEDAFSLFPSLSQSKSKASPPRKMTKNNNIWICACIRIESGRRHGSAGVMARHAVCDFRDDNNCSIDKQQEDQLILSKARSWAALAKQARRYVRADTPDRLSQYTLHLPGPFSSS